MIVVDSSAVVAILTKEPDAHIFVRLIVDCMPSLVSTVTAVECCYVMHLRDTGSGIARLQGLLIQDEIAVTAFDWEQATVAFQARRHCGRGTGHPANLNLGDCFSYALAKTRNLPLLFKGEDFVHTDVEPALKPAWF